MNELIKDFILEVMKRYGFNDETYVISIKNQTVNIVIKHDDDIIVDIWYPEAPISV